MSLTSREKKMIIGIAVVVAAAAIAAAFFIGRRSGDEKTATATTPTQTTQTTPTQTVVTVTTPAETTTATTAAVEIIDFNATPDNIPPGGPVVFTARIRGSAASVKIKLRGPDDKEIELDKKATVDGITPWSASVTGPSIAGAYRYLVEVEASDGSEVETPEGGAKILKVTP